MGAFTDDKGFSWRKMIACITTLIWLAYNVYIIVMKDPSDIPARVQIIIGLVFAFYFGKKGVENIAGKVKELFKKNGSG